MDNFWTVWKFLGLAIFAAEMALLFAMILLPFEQKLYALVAMGVLFLCLFPLAAIDIYQAR